MNAKELAILASAYNVCGLRKGEAAKPSNVLGLADWETLHELVCAYHELALSDSDPLYSPAEISEAACALERANAGGGGVL